MKNTLLVVAITLLLLTASTNTDPTYAMPGAGGEQTPKPLLTLHGPRREVNWVAFSPDGARLATASGGQAVLWDASTGRRLRTLGDESAPLYGPLQFFPGGDRLASVGRFQTTDVWDTATGRLLGALPGHGSWEYVFAVSPTGRYLATTDVLGREGSGAVVIRETRTGQRVSTIRSPRAAITCLAYTADGRRLVTGGLGGEVVLWELASGSAVLTFGSPEGTARGLVRSVMLSRDSKRVAALYWSEDGVIAVWALPSGRRLAVLGAGAIDNAALSPDGKAVAAAALHVPRGPNRRLSNLVTLWDVSTASRQVLLTYDFSDVREGRAARRLAFSPCGTRLATAHGDGTVRIWAVEQLRGKRGER
jgi:WD40 repeat protein